MLVLNLPFKALMFLTLMRPSLVLFLVLWLKLVKDFLKVRCRLALLPFLISCLIWLDLVASLPLIKERILVIILLLHFLSLMLGSVLVLMLPLLVWLTPDLRIKKSLLKCNWTIRSEERFSRNAETDIVCRLLLEKKNINVYPLDAEGDTAPLRVIQGPRTQLDWAGGMQLDPDTQEIYVANDVGSSILVFKETDNGNVAPTRIIKGSKTGLNHPAGISLDLKNKEFWVSNMGNSTATCYSLKANGDATPVRTIRSAPLGRQSVKFGKPQAVAYDSKRQQYLVPN